MTVIVLLAKLANIPKVNYAVVTMQRSHTARYSVLQHNVSVEGQLARPVRNAKKRRGPTGPSGLQSVNILFSSAFIVISF